MSFSAGLCDRSKLRRNCVALLFSVILNVERGAHQVRNPRNLPCKADITDGRLRATSRHARHCQAASSIGVGKVHFASNRTFDFEQRLGLDQVGRPEAFGELIINRLQQRQRFTGATLALKEIGKVASGT